MKNYSVAFTMVRIDAGIQTSKLFIFNYQAQNPEEALGKALQNVSGGWMLFLFAITER